jgi:hypothetical protein
MAETIYGEDQPEYIPLPAVTLRYGPGGPTSVITRWQLDHEERERIAATGDLWLEQLTMGQPLQAFRPTVREPLTDADLAEDNSLRAAHLPEDWQSNVAADVLRWIKKVRPDGCEYFYQEEYSLRQMLKESVSKHCGLK